MPQLSCIEKAVWFGFGVGRAPEVLEDGQCVWPEGSLTTSSGRHCAGRVDEAFHTWLPAADTLVALVTVSEAHIPVGYGQTYQASVERLISGPALAIDEILIYTMDLGTVLLESLTDESPFVLGETLLMTFHRSHEPSAALVGFRDSERSEWRIISVERSE